jgi:hypothetical protein
LPEERRTRFSIFHLTDTETHSFARWTRRFAAAFLLLAALTVVFARSDFFREQVRLKQARRLIESGGYAYCAIWGDGSDPFQLMSVNSPNRPRWKGDRLTDGSYVMTFTYRKSQKEYRHQWKVDLSGKRVAPVDDGMSVPVRSGDAPAEMQCTER